MKREIRHFHVVVVQKRERNVQKSVMHVQSCFLLIKPIVFFLTFSLSSASLDLKVSSIWSKVGSEFGEPGGIPPPRIPRNPPPPQPHPPRRSYSEPGL